MGVFGFLIMTPMGKEITPVNRTVLCENTNLEDMNGIFVWSVCRFTFSLLLFRPKYTLITFRVFLQQVITYQAGFFSTIVGFGPIRSYSIRCMPKLDNTNLRFLRWATCVLMG